MTMRRSIVGSMALLLIPTLACGDPLPPRSASGAPASSEPEALDIRNEALRDRGQIVVDKDGIPHLFAATEADLMYLQGYVHARDRLFQMDVTRRQAEGTLAELLGESALASDVQLRTIGVRRAAERSLQLASAELQRALESYASGVNAFVAAHALPQEYTSLELTKFRPWSEVDSLSVLKLVIFQLSFDLASDIQQTLTLRAYQAAGQQHGFDGTLLFLEDTNRAAPFDSASTIPDARRLPGRGRTARRAPSRWGGRHVSDAVLALARDYLDRLHQAPLAEAATRSADADRGSNFFLVSGRLSSTGQPLVANDPHLPASAPSVFYHIGLSAPAAGIDVIGASFPGAPYIVLGNSKHIAWTATTSYLDVTDAYQERIVADTSSPSGLSTIYKGALEPVVSLPQAFRFNVPGNGATDDVRDEPPGARVPGAVLIVPRRNQGPILQLDRAKEVAISVQYAGSSGTRELDAFRDILRARDVADFGRALRRFDAGSQNFGCADSHGDIAYFLSGENPLREDLQAGKVAGMPPMFIRDGQGGNEWLAPKTQDPTRALPYEVLPAEEMPHIINPPRGFLVSANNDPSGTSLDNDPLNQTRRGGGILYFGAGFDAGVRAGRITQLLDQRVSARRRITPNDLKAIQADTVMNDARYFTPAILAAYAHAQEPTAHAQLRELAADARLAEAVARLGAWDQTTPTGIREGYDAGDEPDALREPSTQEVQHSVAATLYSVWRNQFLKATVAATLERVGLAPFNTPRRESLTAARNLFDRFDAHHGVGASGLDFFAVAGIDDPAARRDLLILRSLASTLDLLASDVYAVAFKRSTRQQDYRWGRLHRLAIPHPIGGQFSVPPGFDAFPAPLGPDLPGIPIDGGLFTVDPASNQLLVDSMDAFIARNVPAQRYVARVRSGAGFEAETSLPGGQSGNFGSPFYLNLLTRYLTNQTHPLRQTRAELAGNVSVIESL